jgi:hypothetical protein
MGDYSGWFSKPPPSADSDEYDPHHPYGHDEYEDDNQPTDAFGNRFGAVSGLSCIAGGDSSRSGGGISR